MTWASPWAWALAVGLALPIVAHLWSRRQPRTIEFPTLRFLQAASPVSRRLRTLQDWPLLVWRMLTVLTVAAAAAGPTIVALARDDADAPWHRVIVVDAAVREAASPLVTRLRAEAVSVSVIDDRPVASALTDAIGLASASARRTRSEIVVVWDGTRPALLSRDLESVPAYVGVRLEPVSVTEPSPRVMVAAAERIAGIALPREAQALREPLLAALSGVRAPRPDVSVRLQWNPEGPTEASSTSAPISSPRLRTVLEVLASDLRVRDAAERSRPAAGAATASDVSAAARINPLLDGRVADNTLVLESLALPDAPLTWWAAVAAVEAAVPWERVSTASTRWTPADVGAVTREPAAPEEDIHASGRHTRAAWLLVLLMLVVEQVWRRTLRMAEARDAA